MLNKPKKFSISLKKSLILSTYHVRSMWNWKNSYLSKFIEPPAYLLLLGGGISAIVTVKNFNYIQFLLSGLTVVILFRAFVSSIADISNDRKWGVLYTFLRSGGSFSGYLFSIYIFYVLIIIIQFVTTIFLAKIFFSRSINLYDYPLIFLKVLIILAGWIGIAAAIGAKIQSYNARDLTLSLISLPVMLSAPVFYPINNAPRYLQIIASFNPLTYQLNWIRQSIMSLPQILGLCAWVLLGTIVGLLALRHSPPLSKENS